ncbi:hypothetical protein JTE90_014776 [Oedothorax gibbosus]|uniref:THAP-type domain-containing protein n=1 Tax=Oedothorax gibbosus TaxID=931172 RepID=A0AAV6UA21_9ARAC|nr:hypothetical protein JTE90_014776 [Oedothorax gibbosus]
MVNKCSVPNCRGNYKNGPKVTVFRFPKGELLRKWLVAIRRNDFKPTSNSRVCELHFTKDDLEYVTEAYDERRGCLISVQLPAPRLRKTAVPSQLDGCPSYLSTTVTYREDPNSRKERLDNEQVAAAIAESLKTCTDYEKKHSFSSFNELLNVLKTADISDFWKMVTENQKYQRKEADTKLSRAVDNAPHFLN